MATVSLQLADELYQRLEHLAELRNISLNNLFEEMIGFMLAEQDLELRRQRGSAEGLLAALEGLEGLEAREKL